MLVIKCEPAYFNEVMAFAASMGLAQQLQENLDRLSTFGGGVRTCHLFKDFAPHSFSFNLYRTDNCKQLWFNGGLIYQGPDSPADGSFPSLTMSLAEGTGWFIHT